MRRFARLARSRRNFLPGTILPALLFGQKLEESGYLRRQRGDRLATRGLSLARRAMESQPLVPRVATVNGEDSIGSAHVRGRARRRLAGVSTADRNPTTP